MRFWKGNQKDRRKAPQSHSLLAHRAVPHLPPPSTSYIASCISRSDRHNCSIHCETEILDWHTRKTWFYVCDRFGLPVQLWRQEDEQTIFSSVYYLEWQAGHYSPKPTSPNPTNQYPLAPYGGSYSYETYSPIF
jgi:hypothetical protein